MLLPLLLLHAARAAAAAAGGAWMLLLHGAVTMRPAHAESVRAGAPARAAPAAPADWPALWAMSAMLPVCVVCLCKRFNGNAEKVINRQN